MSNIKQYTRDLKGMILFLHIHIQSCSTILSSFFKVSFTQTEFIHSRKPDLSKNIHIVTAYSECDPYGKRAECTFKVIVRGMLIS
jgi:hypothetical protein